MVKGDSQEVRKARGAFFTPPQLAEFIVEWAVRSAHDAVFEPSVGDAEFLIAAVGRLVELGGPGAGSPRVHGVEIHGPSADEARTRISEAGGSPTIETADFFDVAPDPRFDAVIGNPPYVRFQEFSGEARAKGRRAALAGGVSVSGLASSWAPFVVHAASFLADGARLGLVLPAELLTVNYAAPIRRFLFDSFASVEIVLFDEQVFPGAEADVVLVLADGFREGPTEQACFRTTANASSLASIGNGRSWSPAEPGQKWTASLVGDRALAVIRGLETSGDFVNLKAWGETTLGAVTGNNKYFALSPERVRQQGIARADLLPLSPPGSRHLRKLSLTAADLARLGEEGKSTQLFFPRERLNQAARSYIAAGEVSGVDTAYKCRVRRDWYRVPVVAPADLLLTCMNSDTPRLILNEADAYHLNSVHGVYLHDDVREFADLLAVAALNSATQLHAEMIGRSYGGGILKLEPREADGWIVPSLALVMHLEGQLRDVRSVVEELLDAGRVDDATRAVDEIIFGGSEILAADVLRNARELLASRRTRRGRSGK
jgi:adenine-specific DNA-methyltransferase